MTGQRDNIEVLRDCLRILQEVDSVTLTGKQNRAIKHYVEETMDAILRPLYKEGLE